MLLESKGVEMISGAALYIKKGTGIMGVQTGVLMGILNFYSFMAPPGWTSDY